MPTQWAQYAISSAKILTVYAVWQMNFRVPCYAHASASRPDGHEENEFIVTSCNDFSRRTATRCRSGRFGGYCGCRAEFAAGFPKGLRNYWYPVLQSEELEAGKAFGFTVLGENSVAWRGRDGAPCVAHDRCPHRSIKLSVGRVFDGQLQCILHGLRFSGAGQCIMVPWGGRRLAQGPLAVRCGLPGGRARRLHLRLIPATPKNFHHRRSSRRCRKSLPNRMSSSGFVCRPKCGIATGCSPSMAATRFTRWCCTPHRKP